MDLTAKLRLEASSIRDTILEHPFVVELYSGDLPLILDPISLMAARADFELT